jgi:hypothetical protein
MLKMAAKPQNKRSRDEALDPPASSHLHAFRFKSVDEIDHEVALWLPEAYRVGEQRHLV